MKIKKGLLITTLFIGLLVGCTNEETTHLDTSDDIEQETSSLSIGIMPAVDAAPIFVAKRNGYFENLGLDLEVTIYSNANNRQSALQANELDGAMTDLIAVLNNQHNGFGAKIVTNTDGSFAFLTNEDFDPATTNKVGLMEISVANYLADEYVVPHYDIDKVYINEIPARLEMLNTGQLEMGFIPEPAASSGELNGLTKHITVTEDNGYSLQGMVFTPEALETNQKAIEKFIEGYNEAIDAIQDDQSIALDTLIDELDLDPNIRDLMTLPDYQHARVPSEAYVNEVIEWVEAVQGIELDVDYNNMITTEFLTHD